MSDGPVMFHNDCYFTLSFSSISSYKNKNKLLFFLPLQQSARTSLKDRSLTDEDVDYFMNFQGWHKTRVL